MSDARNELLERWLESPALSESPRERPKASWSKLGEAFMTELTRSWETHGKDAIGKIADQKPEVYVKLVASFVTKDVEPQTGAFDDVSDAELATFITAARAASKRDDASGGGSDKEG